MKLSSSQRKLAYVVLAIVNFGLTVCSQQGILPAGWVHAVALASLLMAGLMKEFQAEDEVTK